MNDEKLRIAVEALLAIAKHQSEGWESNNMRNVAKQALRKIRREHYLASPSPVVTELIGAGKEL